MFVYRGVNFFDFIRVLLSQYLEYDQQVATWTWF